MLSICSEVLEQVATVSTIIHHHNNEIRLHPGNHVPCLYGESANEKATVLLLAAFHSNGRSSWLQLSSQRSNMAVFYTIVIILSVVVSDHQQQTFIPRWLLLLSNENFSWRIAVFRNKNKITKSKDRKIRDKVHVCV